MIVRVGILVTCSLAVIRFRQLKSKKHHHHAIKGQPCEEHALQIVRELSYDGALSKEENLSIEEESIFDPLVSQQKTPPEEVKRVDSGASAEVKFQDSSEDRDKDLLLPEFDDLVHSKELTDLNVSLETTSGDDHGSDGDGVADIAHKADPSQLTEESEEAGVTSLQTGSLKNRSEGKYGSRRSPSPARRPHHTGVCGTDGEDLQNMSCATSDASDWFPEGPDYLFGDYVDGLANDVAELHALKEMMKDMKENETILEGKLLELQEQGREGEEKYVKLQGHLEDKTAQILKLEKDLVKVENELKERSTQVDKLQLDFSECERLMEEKNAQNAKLKARIAALEARATKLSEEAANVTIVRKDLEESRTRNKELQLQISSDHGDAKLELLTLKQKLVDVQEEKEESNRRNLDTEDKLQILRELEVEVVELRRTIKELQHQKREVTVKLTTAETDNEYLLNRIQEDILAEADAQLAGLRHVNEDLNRQVEGLQNERFTEVEELVYLRWVNACLRYELRNFQASGGKKSAVNLSKSLSPKSQEKAKKLMMQYAGPQDNLAIVSKEQMESDESTSSDTSAHGESNEALSEMGSVTGSGRMRRPSLIQRLKSWSNKKEDGSDISSATPSMDRDRSPRVSSEFTIRRKSLTTLKPPLEALILRNASDGVEIVTYGTNPSDPELGFASPRSQSTLSSPGARSSRSNTNSPYSLTPVRTRKSSLDKDGFNGIAASFQIIAKSVPPEFSGRYPAFKDRHNAAVEREQSIKEKVQAERERVMSAKWSQKSTLETNGDNQINESEPTSGGANFISKPLSATEVEKRALRKPTPPPKPTPSKPSLAGAPQLRGFSEVGAPPPPPPPPPPRGAAGAPPSPPPPPFKELRRVQGKHFDNMHRAPEVVQLYQTMMKREGKNNGGDATTGDITVNAHNHMIGEIENRSAYLLAIKADVETQGEFVMALAAEVRAAVYTNIEDVVAFVNWLDEELSFLVDERAVLKHFDWPEGKADAIREAAFEYKDLTKLLEEVSLFEDNPAVPCEKALKKMLSILEKVEQGVYGLLRTRDMAIVRYREFSIPTQWTLDSGVVGKIKVASVRLAQLYMKRVAAELKNVDSMKEPVREFLLLQGVRFAFRVHQFAGGFDPESMKAFESLRACATAYHQQSPPSQKRSPTFQEDSPTQQRSPSQIEAR